MTSALGILVILGGIAVMCLAAYGLGRIDAEKQERLRRRKWQARMLLK